MSDISIVTGQGHIRRIHFPGEPGRREPDSYEIVARERSWRPQRFETMDEIGATIDELAGAKRRERGSYRLTSTTPGSKRSHDYSGSYRWTRGRVAGESYGQFQARDQGEKPLYSNASGSRQVSVERVPYGRDKLYVREPGSRRREFSTKEVDELIGFTPVATLDYENIEPETEEVETITETTTITHVDGTKETHTRTVSSGWDGTVPDEEE